MSKEVYYTKEELLSKPPEELVSLIESLIDERIKIRNNYLKLFKNNSLELIINKIF